MRLYPKAHEAFSYFLIGYHTTKKLKVNSSKILKNCFEVRLGNITEEMSARDYPIFSERAANYIAN
jgi:hypothetical protein